MLCVYVCFLSWVWQFSAGENSVRSLSVGSVFHIRHCAIYGISVACGSLAVSWNAAQHLQTNCKRSDIRFLLHWHFDASSLVFILLKEEKVRRQLRVKLDMAQFLQDTLEELSLERKKTEEGVSRSLDFAQFIKKVNFLTSNNLFKGKLIVYSNKVDQMSHNGRPLISPFIRHWCDESALQFWLHA